MKTCKECNETKPLDCFNKNQSKCKACISEYDKRRYQENRDRILARQAKYNKSEAGKAVNAEYRKSEAGKARKERFNTKIPPGVYCIKNLKNNKLYIGESKVPIDREHKHWSKLRLKKHENPHLQSDYNKYGAEQFVFEMLQVVPDATKAELLKLERQWINKHKGNCYNIL
jgi:hypothetical protein